MPVAALGSLEKSFKTRSWLPLSSSLSASSSTKNLTASVASLPDSMKSMMRPAHPHFSCYQHASDHILANLVTSGYTAVIVAQE